MTFTGSGLFFQFSQLFNPVSLSKENGKKSSTFPINLLTFLKNISCDNSAPDCPCFWMCLNTSCLDQSGQPAPVWNHLRRQPGGGGQGEHDERRGGLHGRRQDHRQRPDDVQVATETDDPGRCSSSSSFTSKTAV